MWGWRPAVRALEDVSFSVDAGEIMGVIGPNRAGKTTLIKILLSICHPTAGEVQRFGLPAQRRGTLARVGYIHESQAFPRYLTARQLLHYYGALSLTPPEVLSSRAGALLERVGLGERSNEPIAQFSKGMLQRLALAQALVSDPDLLVLDEPSEGMDLRARRLLNDILIERRQAGRTAILVSHALADVERLCDRVAVLRRGRLAYLGAVDELKSKQAQSTASTFEGSLEPFYEEALA